MACIVKKPVAGTKGVLVITDGELRDFLEVSPTIQSAFRDLRQRWIIVVHCNSAVQQKVRANPLVDAYIAGPGDIIPVANFTPQHIAMDCSNFCPSNFRSDPDARKFWDILFVSRNQKFKSIDALFKIVRALFDQRPARVLAIIAHENAAQTADSEPVRLYTSMFSVEERKFFTLLTPWIDYPFCFDLQTLANFYHQSRCFLHTADAERHPRVVAYAWAAGLPVIAPPNVAALLPDAMRQPPGFFAFETPEQAAANLNKVLNLTQPLPAAYSQYHLAAVQIPRFQHEIGNLYERLGQTFADGGWFLANLDIRLARHHDQRAGINTARTSLLQLARQLALPFPDLSADDVEIMLDATALRQPDQDRADLEAAARRRSRPLTAFHDYRRQHGLFPALGKAMSAPLRNMFRRTV